MCAHLHTFVSIRKVLLCYHIHALPSRGLEIPSEILWIFLGFLLVSGMPFVHRENSSQTETAWFEINRYTPCDPMNELHWFGRCNMDPRFEIKSHTVTYSLPSSSSIYVQAKDFIITQNKHTLSYFIILCATSWYDWCSKKKKWVLR